MTTPPKTTEIKAAVTSPMHRHVAVDSFGLRVNDNLAQLVMSLETMDDAGKDIIVKEVTAVMTHRSLKVLTLLLAGVVARFEKNVGAIELPQSKLDELAGKN